MIRPDRALCAILMLAACGGSSASHTPNTPSNTTPSNTAMGDNGGAAAAEPHGFKTTQLALTPVSASGSLACDASSTSGVHGMLTDFDGRPLAGATLVVSTPAAGSQTALTDDTGCYDIPDVAPGTVDVTVYYADGTATTSTAVPATGRARVDGRIVEPPNPSDIVTLPD